MTKADIAQRIQAKLGLTKHESSDQVESVLSIIKNTFEGGENTKISGFGNFEIKQKKDRIGRNPKTGESYPIEARRVLTFKPSTVLRAAINS